MKSPSFFPALLIMATACIVSAQARDTGAATLTPSGQALTPMAAQGALFQKLNPHLDSLPDFTAGQAVTTVVSPDGGTLLILTSGFNRNFTADGKLNKAASNEYVFVYDIAAAKPARKQVLQLANTYMGIAFAPDGKHFYVSGGVDDDVRRFALNNGNWAEQGKPFDLGHYAHLDRTKKAGGLGLGVQPQAAGLAVTADGKRLLVANFYNDSVSLVDLATGKATEIPLRPGLINPEESGKPGGTYPYWVAIKGSETAYVSSERDREIDVLRLTGTPGVIARIKISGNPNRMALNKAGTLLYVACDNEAHVEVIDTVTNKVAAIIPATAPVRFLPKYAHGTASNSLALSPDERRLYVTNGGTNSVAVIGLGAHPGVIGLIPTGYYPNSVSAKGAMLYVVNGKSVPGPNPGNCSTNSYNKTREYSCGAPDQYILQLSKAGFLSLPVPHPVELQNLTKLVARNNHFGFAETPQDRATMAFLHRHIKHVIYIIRENRTYDQILGDLGEGNGDPSLAEFGAAITPNIHRLARHFVDIDNFYDTGEVSGNGWPWSTSARESDLGSKNLPVNYAGRGLSYDWEGANRNVDVALPTLAARRAENPAYPNDPNLLPGIANVAAPDGPQGQYQKGYLWDAALRAGLSIRNYGFFIDLDRYFLPPSQGGIAEITDPYKAGVKVAFSTSPSLAPFTDPYFRGFDNNMPDYFREAEWAREFAVYVKHGNLPSLEFVRLMHDHLGSFATAIDRVNTPDTEVADNDEAVGRLIQTVAHSPYAKNTLIFVVEDDAQDGPDHVDAHRSVAFIVGPYVKRHAVVDARYTTVNMLRTIEDVLGFGPMTLNDAYEGPMTEAFDTAQASWTYQAVEPAPLTATSLPFKRHAAVLFHDIHAASWWAAQTRGYDWHREDKIPAEAFNRILWQGLKPGQPYPTARSER